MAKLILISENRYRFRCPGCGDLHEIPVNPEKLENGSSWDFNFDLDRPTFSPSLVVNTGHFVKDFEGDTCWCTYRKEHPEFDADPKYNSIRCYICHSFITDGKIQFLGDCTHALVGQTVELADIPAGARPGTLEL